MIITVYAAGFIQESAFPPKTYLTNNNDKTTIKNTGKIGQFCGINIPIKRPCTIAVKSNNVLTRLILLLINSAKTEAKIDVVIKNKAENAFVISNITICGTNKIKKAVEIFVSEGDKYEKGAIVKSL